MNRQRVLSFVIITTAVFCLVLLSWKDQAATSASQPIACSEGDKDSLSSQVKELQKQVHELQKQVGGQKPHIVAAGTATWKCPDVQRNTLSTRVKLPKDVVKGLGTDYIVLLTNRLPAGYPYFVPHWKLAEDGFDITPVDTAVSDTTAASYAVKRTYLIDWVVVKK
jgi:outer membrane murein-binding lipoprotein Lpp